ncbi:leucine-rich repeat domain-containing protein [Chryseobacterium oncorhynchi]|uniref:Uncharacterized protein n=1 Tax=Chryseobacterium oncorhynchi TaxID=741074 RepID=A0A316X4B6_9FLAO|nr:leucine-rich repeat domain-containing protein [Chryseobacterium oncorhynchi]PWN67263.1 hypothetical protein C1638_001270 [Chryseobacterium oncorhynchi]
MNKPQEIVELESIYNLELNELPEEKNIMLYEYKNHYEINKERQIIGISLCNNEIFEIESIKCLKFLSKLNLSGNQITEIKNLKELKLLSELNLSDNQIIEINNLEELNLLSKLNLSENQITEIKNLEELKLLSELNLSRNQITEIKNLEELKLLSELNLSRNQITEIKNLQDLKLLSELNLSRNQIYELKRLEELKLLSKLDISENQITEIKNLEELKLLSELNLSENQIAEIKNLERLKLLSQLNLSDNKISELKNLEELKELSLLYLSDNQISEIKNLERLKLLSQLNLSRNQITELKNLEELKELSLLYLSDNQISEIKNLERLKLLSQLNLSDNQISEIKNLERLKLLSQLNLSDNQITDIKNLEELKLLSTLNLSENQISKIKNLEELKQLSELDLSRNQITEIKNLEELKHVLVLNFYGNQIIEIKNLKKLEQLSGLNLSENRITEIKNLESLKELSVLYLSENQITEIKNLEGLKKLSILNLSGNKIAEIKNLEGLKQLSSINLSKNLIYNISSLLPYFRKGLDIVNDKYFFYGIFLEDNPLIKPPMAVVQQGKEKIIEWFEEAENYGTEPLYEAKLLIVGEPRHGKSSLRKKLLDNEYKIPDQYLEETLGVEIHSDYVVQIPEKKEHILVNIWDFGGQEKQYYLHQYFLKKNAVYILVSDNRKDNPNFDYWMSKLKLFTGNENKILILFNQINRTTESTNFNSKQYEKLGFLFKEFHQDLSKDADRFFEFKNYIDKSILQLPHIGEEYPKYCKAISDKIDKKKETDNLDYMTIQDFESLCSELNYNEPKIIQKTLEYLDLIGKIIYYEEDTSLSHLIILNPHWLIDAIYGIITSKELEGKNGKFTKEWLNDYLGSSNKKRSKTYSKSEIDNILRLMLKNHYDICYTLNDSDYLIPLLMPNELPNNDIDFSDGLQVIFKYEIMPKGLIPRVLVRKSEYIHNNLICSNAGVLLSGSTWAKITEHFEKNDANRYIKITTKGENQVELLQEIRTELLKVQKSWFNNLEVVELIPCNCNECKESSLPQLYDREKDLIRKTKKGKLKIECRKSDDHVEIIPLLGAVYDKKIIEFYTREEMQKMKILPSFNIKNFNVGDVYDFGDGSILEKNQIGGKHNKQEN